MEIIITVLIGSIIIYTIILFNLITFCRNSHLDTVEIFELISKRLSAQEKTILLLKKNQEKQSKKIKESEDE